MDLDVGEVARNGKRGVFRRHVRSNKIRYGQPRVGRRTGFGG